MSVEKGPKGKGETIRETTNFRSEGEGERTETRGSYKRKISTGHRSNQEKTEEGAPFGRVEGRGGKNKRLV